MSAMSPHLFVLLWVLILSQCNTGYSIKEAVGKTIGDRCDRKCDGENLVCHVITKECRCNETTPIVVITTKNTRCQPPAKLGEECLSNEVCLDANTHCFQTDAYNAFCSCKSDYHELLDKSSGRFLCVPEARLLNSDLATLLGVGAGMTLFCILTCLVLRIFARARFGPGAHHYGNAQLPPPITLSADHGDTRGQSRNSSQRSSLVTEGSRRTSKEGSLLAPPSRQGDRNSKNTYVALDDFKEAISPADAKVKGEGSRRASNSSIRSTGSNRSQRSYSLRNPSHHNNHLHQALQHRPSDPESRSQTSQFNLSVNRPSSQDNVSGGGSVSSTSASQQPSPHSPHQMQKGKRSGSAGMLQV